MNWATAPLRNTTVAMPPTATSETPPIRSSITFGSAIVTVLKTRPAVMPIRTNRANTETISHMASRTSGKELRPAASWLSSGTNLR